MQQYATVTLGGPRWQPLFTTLRFVGIDLTGADFRLQVRLQANTPGVPEIDLQTVSTAAAEGVRLIGVETIDGKPVSTVGIRVNETTMESLPFTGEAGGDSLFEWDMQVTPAGGYKAKWIGGSFIAERGVTGADNAPYAPSPTPGYGQALARRSTSGAPTFQVGETVINVQMLAPGLVIQSDGEVSPGSVGADQIVAGPADQAALLAKLIYAGESVADQLDAANSNRAVQASAVQPGSAPAVAAIDFAAGFVPGETPANALSLSGGATAAIVVGGGSDSPRAVSVMAPYDQPTKRSLSPVSFAEGTLTFQVLRGPDNARSTFMLTIMAPDGRARAVWSSDGTSLSYGYLAPDGTPSPLGNLPNSFIGGGNGGADGANVLVNIELMTPPVYPGLTWYVRSWVDGGTRPTDEQAMKAAYPSGEPAGAAGSKVNQGRIGIASIGANPAQIARIRSLDGQRGTKLTGKAYLRGRWFSRFDGGRLVMASGRGAGSLKMLVTGTNDIAIDYVGTPSGAPVALDPFVNGGRVGGPITLNVGAGQPGTKGIVLGLDPAAVSQVELRVRGVDVFSNMWYRGAGALIEDIRPSLPGGRIMPWVDQRPKLLFVGDSITAGSVARGTSSDPVDYGGDITWPVQASEATGWQAIVSAFGGTGATVGIADGNTSPSAMQHAFSYMQGRPIDGGAENIRAIVVNLGTNDKSQGVSNAAFKAGYKQLLARLLRENPGAAKVLAMYPLNGSYAAQIFEAVGDMQDPRVLVFDTSSWTGITYTDGLHPDVAGHGVIAGYVAPVLRTLLTGAMA